MAGAISVWCVFIVRGPTLTHLLVWLCAGYDNEGYDKYGYDKYGYSKYGEWKQMSHPWSSAAGHVYVVGRRQRWCLKALAGPDSSMCAHQGECPTHGILWRSSIGPHSLTKQVQPQRST
jgi:hypothetical protein